MISKSNFWKVNKTKEDEIERIKSWFGSQTVNRGDEQNTYQPDTAGTSNNLVSPSSPQQTVEVRSSELYQSCSTTKDVHSTGAVEGHLDSEEKA